MSIDIHTKVATAVNQSMDEKCTVMIDVGCSQLEDAIEYAATLADSLVLMCHGPSIEIIGRMGGVPVWNVEFRHRRDY